MNKKINGARGKEDKINFRGATKCTKNERSLYSFHSHKANLSFRLLYKLCAQKF